MGCVVSAWCVWWVMTRRSSSSAQKSGLLHLFSGKYIHPQRCSTTFHWEDPCPVGTTVAFTVHVGYVFLYCIPVWGFTEFLRLMLQYPIDNSQYIVGYCYDNIMLMDNDGDGDNLMLVMHTILSHNCCSSTSVMDDPTPSVTQMEYWWR